MAKFALGDVVTDGKRVGQIDGGFYWKHSDDGTMNEPKSGFFPVIWKDDTRGYRHENDLEFA